MKLKKLGNFRTKWALRGADGPVWMSLALNPPCLIQFWSLENSPFPLLALWGNKKWLPSMKVKKLGKFQNKMGLKGCRWSSLNVPGSKTLSIQISCGRFTKTGNCLGTAEFPVMVKRPHDNILGLHSVQCKCLKSWVGHSRECAAKNNHCLITYWWPIYNFGTACSILRILMNN